MPPSSNASANPLEKLLLAYAAALVMLAVFGPDITQPLHQHAFADNRNWASISNAMDVLSNLAFAAWGVVGLIGLNKHKCRERLRLDAEHALAALFFVGLVSAAAASAWYHLRPDDWGLGMDRLGMVLAFAGLLGLAVAGQVSHRAGAIMAGAVLLAGPLSIWFWLSSGNVLPWVVIQFGGLALMLLVACIEPQPGSLGVRWGIVVALYAAAKLLELGDHDVYAMTGGGVSGHSLKHVVASFAAWPVVQAIGRTTCAVRTRDAMRPKRSGLVSKVGQNPAGKA